MTDRIETLGGVSQLEIMAPSVNINWDPITNTGPIAFRMFRYLVQDDVIRQDVDPSPAGSFMVGMENILLRCFVPANPGDNILDPVTGADLSNVSVAGVMTIIKAAFDTLYTEHLETQITPPETP